MVNTCLGPEILLHGVHQIRKVDKKPTASKENRGEIPCKMPAWGASRKALGLGLEICKSRGGGDQREPRGAFSLAEGSTRQVLNQGAEE